jgi:hypothetical protein
MSRPLEDNDTLPWYRHFWLWFIIMLPASVVVAGFVTLYIANRYSDDLVVDEYYKNGLAINRQLEKKQRAHSQGIAAQLSFHDTSVVVSLTGPVNDESLHLLLSHPLEADKDFELTLIRSYQGVYQGKLEQVIAPRWHWTLEVQQPNGWRLDGAVQADDIIRADDS